MTQDEMMLLGKGRVPSFIVTQALTQHLSENDRNTLEVIDVLAEKASIPYNTLEMWYVNPERTRSVDFDAADRLLAAMGLWHWWYNRFRDYYEAVDLAWKECECPGCSNMIRIAHTHVCRYEGCGEQGRTRGLCGKHYQIVRRDGLLHRYPPQGKNGNPKYCSKACSDSAWNQAHGRTRRVVKHFRGAATADKCRNGHERTPENTMTRRNGKTECRICARENNRKSYHARRQAVLAA